MRPSVADMVNSSNSLRIGSTSSSVSTSTSGSPPRRTSIDVLPVGTATQRAPIERPQRMSLSVSPMTISSPCGAAVEMRSRGGERGGRNVVAIDVLVAEAAEREPVPELVVHELAAGRLADIAREQTEGHVAAGGERFQQRRRRPAARGPCRRAALPPAAQRKPARNCCQFSAVGSMPCSANRSIAIARSLRPANATPAIDGIGDAEVLGERHDERRLARAAGRNQRAVDVEKADVHSVQCNGRDPCGAGLAKPGRV